MFSLAEYLSEYLAEYLAEHHIWQQIARLLLPQILPQQQPKIRPDLFEHEALDLESPSLRLIQICPALYSGGPIRCRIRVASTDTEYTCLSYVWGEERTGKRIYINNKRFKVRQNLLDFLQSARQVPELTSRWLWIDALCIDQTNTHERQHQVQQMARIYAGAKEVISWLGTDRDLAIFFHKRACGWDMIDYGAIWALSRSPYWTRAWIVQEILLAHHVRLMADIYLLPLDALPPLRTAKLARGSPYERIQTRFVHMRKLLKCPEQSGITLIYLLYYFQHQSCHIDRDRIFSLLGLCKDGMSLQVDYSTSTYELAVKVLASCRDTFCVCTIQTVATALRLSSSCSPGDYSHDFRSTTYASLTLPITWAECMRPHRGDCPRNDPHSIVVCRPTSISTGHSIKITINLQHLCSKYCDQITIKVYHTRVKIIYSSNGCKRWNWYDGGSIALQSLDNGQACKILMSLALWFRIIDLAKREYFTTLSTLLEETCCSRVTGGANIPVENSHRPALKLWVDKEHIGEYSSLPNELDRFTFHAWQGSHKIGYK
jgi:hypothetical protein